MYLHLAEVEIALAAREDALDERLTPEKAEVPAITEQGNETLTPALPIAGPYG